jgi:hypothetical protein
MRATASEIEAEWVRLATHQVHDPFVNDSAVQALLTLGSDDATKIENYVEGISLLARANPGFFATCDYEWAADPGAYAIPMEASFQLRLLAALSDVYRLNETVRFGSPSLLANMVVRRTWMMDAFAARPLTPIADASCRYRFIVVPLGFIENAALAFRAALDVTQRERAVAALFAIYLSSAFTDTLDPLVVRQIQRRLLSDAPAFRSAIKHVDGFECTPIEGAWAFALCDFVMLHEAGHIYYCDGPDVANNEPAEDRANEFAVDVFGLSSGWRAADMSRRGAPQLLATIGGGISFMTAVAVLLQLQSQLARRLATIDATPTRLRSADRLQTAKLNMARRCAALDNRISALEKDLMEAKTIAAEECSEVRSILAAIEPISEMGRRLVERIETADLVIARDAVTEARRLIPARGE